MTPEYLSIKDAAFQASMHEKTLREWIETGRVGRGEGVYKVGGRWKINWERFKKAVIESGKF